MRSTIRVTCLATFLVALAACGDGHSGGVADGGSASADSGDRSAAALQPSVRTATMPSDPCGWIPVAEVEAILGQLASSSIDKGGCRYTMKMPDAVSARRRDAIAEREQLTRQLKEGFPGWEPPEYGGPLADFERDPTNYAVTLTVNVEGGTEEEMAWGAVSKLFGNELGQSGADEPKPDLPNTGWDHTGGVPYGFSGRIGHIRIVVQGEAPDVPAESMEGLAAALRDRLPDLPFPAANPYQVPQAGAADRSACDLVTRAEAEAELGELVVDPYPSSSYYPPLAHAQGNSCAYYTTGHHVFVLSPTWRDGEQSFGMEEGVGGLLSAVLPQELVVIKGPWDRAQISAATGALLFLKGDRLLEVHYKTSSTDMRGAVRLAAKAMERLDS